MTVTGALALGLLSTSTLAQAAAAAPASSSGTATSPASPAAGTPQGLTPQQQAIFDALTRAKSTGQPVVVDAMTTDSSQTLVNPDGKLTSTDYSQPMRTKRGSGWTDLDATLQKNADGSISPAVTTNGLTISGGGNGPMATTTTADGKVLAVTAPFPLPSPTLQGTTATYANVLPDVDLQVSALTNGGWRDVIVVKSSAAAANPQLSTLHFPLTATGLTVSTDAAGNVDLKDSDGKVRMHAPTPFQWDSTGAASATPNRSQATATPASLGLASAGRSRSLAVMASASDSGAPSAPGNQSSTVGPGDQANQSAISVKATDASLDLTPDPTTFGKGTGPWYLDPTISADSGENAAAQVQEYHRDTSYYSTAATDLGTGYCGYSGCNGGGRERAYFQLGISPAIYTQPSGAPQPPTVYNSTFYANVDGASNPNAPTSLGLYWTPPINSGTTWNTQPCDGGGTFGGCGKVGGSTPITGTGPITFDVTSQMQQAASQKWSTWTVGIAPDDENNADYRHHIASGAHITTTYDIAPSIWYPRTSPVPGSAGSGSYNECQTPGGGYAWYNPGWLGSNQNVTLTASAWSPTGFNLTDNFHVWDDNAPGWNLNLSTSAPAYGSASVNVSAGQLTDGHQYGWQASSTDGPLSSPGSDLCYFRVDRTPPTVSVSSTDFPPSGTPNNNPKVFSTDPGTFILTGTDPAPNGGAASGVACFMVSTSSSPSSNWHCGDKNISGGTVLPAVNGSASYTYPPGLWGTNTLYAQAQDNAGNYSQPVRYDYYAPWKPGSKPVFGDVNGDGKPDILLPDSHGNLRLIQPGIDPAGTSTISADPTTAVGGDGWNGMQITHRASLLGGKSMDDLIVHPANDAHMYLYQNDGHGHFGPRIPFYKSGGPTLTAVQCQDANGTTITCPADFGGNDWTNTTQVLALGTPDGEGLTPSTDAQGNPVNLLSRTSLLAVISGQLWLFPPGATSARLLKPTDRQLSGADWSQYDLIGPGPANGNNQPTLWSRSRIDGTMHAYPITKNADGTTNYSALADPGSGYIAGSGGIDPTDYPSIGSVGDLTGDNVADLWAVTKDHHLLVWPGNADGTGKVIGFAAPNDLGPVDAAVSPTLASGTVLRPGDTAYSAHTRLTMQLDGNLVLYSRNTGQSLWNTKTYGHPGAWATMQADGNLVVYLPKTDANGNPSYPTPGAAADALWSSGTPGNNGAHAVVQDDCNFVIYDAGGASKWNSGTYNPNP